VTALRSENELDRVSVPHQEYKGTEDLLMRLAKIANLNRQDSNTQHPRIGLGTSRFDA
jgi:hypothetical protein